MDEDGRRSPDTGQGHGHHDRRGHRGSNSNPNGNGNARRSLYRMSSNQSRSSIFEDVEMAQEEVTMNYALE
jgi:cation-transporting ATPase 13A2